MQYAYDCRRRTKQLAYRSFRVLNRQPSFQRMLHSLSHLSRFVRIHRPIVNDFATQVPHICRFIRRITDADFFVAATNFSKNVP